MRFERRYPDPEDVAEVEYTVFNIEGVGYLRFSFFKGGKPVAFPVHRNGRFVQHPLYRIDDITVREAEQIKAEFMIAASDIPEEPDDIRRLPEV
jgi:hypothetical protein